MTNTDTKTSWTPEQTNNILALVQKLQGLGIDAKPSGIEQGPVVTAYLLDLGKSESINRVMRRAEDFALSLDVDKVIIQRIKGKIAVFIPNKERTIVDFKDVLYWYLNDEQVKAAKLPIPLGVDFHGDKAFLDIADCPHLLITGSTGSGKSVFEAAIVSSLVYKFSASELNLYLVDTKKLDLPLFKEVNHVKSVADNLDDFHTMMFWIMTEIRRRNSVMQNASVRNITDYHLIERRIKMHIRRFRLLKVGSSNAVRLLVRLVFTSSPVHREPMLRLLAVQLRLICHAVLLYVVHPK